jgi:hypothetical protein
MRTVEILISFLHAQAVNDVPNFGKHQTGEKIREWANSGSFCAIDRPQVEYITAAP